MQGPCCGQRSSLIGIYVGEGYQNSESTKLVQATSCRLASAQGPRPKAESKFCTGQSHKSAVRVDKSTLFIQEIIGALLHLRAWMPERVWIAAPQPLPEGSDPCEVSSLPHSQCSVGPHPLQSFTRTQAGIRASTIRASTTFLAKVGRAGRAGLLRTHDC